jgi:hypothetical protein
MISPEAHNIAMAIKTVESSNCKNKKGASGEYGCFQWLRSTYETISIEIEGYVLPKTDINEYYIAVQKIQKLLDKGNTPQQIAMIWNGSLGGTEKPIAKRGRNRRGVKYDTVAYANKVLAHYETIKQQEEIK